MVKRVGNVGGRVWVMVLGIREGCYVVGVHEIKCVRTVSGLDI